MNGETVINILKLYYWKKNSIANIKHYQTEKSHHAVEKGLCLSEGMAIFPCLLNAQVL